MYFFEWVMGWFGTGDVITFTKVGHVSRTLYKRPVAKTNFKRAVARTNYSRDRI